MGHYTNPSNIRSDLYASKSPAPGRSAARPPQKAPIDYKTKPTYANMPIKNLKPVHQLLVNNAALASVSNDTCKWKELRERAGNRDILWGIDWWGTCCLLEMQRCPCVKLRGGC